MRSKCSLNERTRLPTSRLQTTDEAIAAASRVVLQPTAARLQKAAAVEEDWLDYGIGTLQRKAHQNSYLAVQPPSTTLSQFGAPPQPPSQEGTGTDGGGGGSRRNSNGSCRIHGCPGKSGIRLSAVMHRGSCSRGGGRGGGGGGEGHGGGEGCGGSTEESGVVVTAAEAVARAASDVNEMAETAVDVAEIWTRWDGRKDEQQQQQWQCQQQSAADSRTPLLFASAVVAERTKNFIHSAPDLGVAACLPTDHQNYDRHHHQHHHHQQLQQQPTTLNEDDYYARIVRDKHPSSATAAAITVSQTVAHPESVISSPSFLMFPSCAEDDIDDDIMLGNRVGVSGAALPRFIVNSDLMI